MMPTSLAACLLVLGVCAEGCTPTLEAQDGGPDGRAPVPDGSVVPEPSSVEGGVDAEAAAEPPATDDATSAPGDALASSDEGFSADVVAPVYDGSFAVPPGPHWANWPMPNPASSGFPNPSSYDTSIAGVVLDNVTHLMWQRADAMGAGTTMQDAAEYCAGLHLGGFTDWRLPSRIEVWSIQDFQRGSPAIDPAFSVWSSTDASGSTRYGDPWTSTYGYGSYTTFGVGFSVGTPMSVSMFNGEATTGGSSIRCVRGSTVQPSPHYTVSNGTVFDNGTKLTWQRGFDPAPSLPNGVANYCASLTLAGGGWRAPSVKELETLVDETRVAPAIDTDAFLMPPSAGAATYDDYVFHSTSPWNVVQSTQETWYVDFADGSNGTASNSLVVPPITTQNNLFQVRCVR